MRKEITRSSLSVTLRLVSDIVEENESALQNFGAENHPSIISRRTQNQQLSELLNILERKIEILESKYLEAFATYNTDTTTPLVPLYGTAIDEAGTNETP